VRSVPAPRRPISGATVSTTLPLHRLRALPDHRWLDSLLRSRAWIWIMGIGLGGIVFMQVSLLKMNAGIGMDVQKSTELQHANAALEEQVAELSSGERIADQAGKLGLIVPNAGDVGYLTVRAQVDAARAAQNMTAPSDAARQELASGGKAQPTAVATPVPTAVATPVPTATPVAPVATATPAPTTTATVPAQ
jgi:cell division protein FtsL